MVRGLSRVVVCGFLVACTACTGEPAVECTSDDECGARMCTDGRCVDRPDAGPVDAAACGPACECLIDDDCPPVAPCAVRRCEANLCVVEERDELCAPVGVCDGYIGCVTPGEDAGVDAGPDLDAGTPVDAGPPPPPHPVGQACSATGECDTAALGTTARCVDRSRTGDDFPAGYCTARCIVPSICPDGSACWQGGTFFDQFCLRSCTSDRDCRAGEGYVCGVPSSGDLSVSGSVCIPASLAR